MARYLLLACLAFGLHALVEQLAAVARGDLRDALLGLRDRLVQTADCVGLRFELAFFFHPRALLVHRHQFAREAFFREERPAFVLRD